MILGLNKIIKILFYLRKNGKTKLHELGAYIDSDKRTARRIVDTLKKSGYNVVSKSGRFGGVWIEEPTLTDTEWIILKEKLKNNKSIYDKIDYRLNKTF